MLELRPGCEHCNLALPANSTDAMICSFECTFCSGCVHNILQNVCPNCGGGFASRPVRPAANLKNGNYLGAHPAVDKATHKPVNVESHQAFSKELKEIPPEQR